MKKRYIMLAFLAVCSVLSYGNDFVCRSEGDFKLAGNTVRFSGINIMLHHVQDYTGIETILKRMSSMGFNIAHIWIPDSYFHEPGRKWNDFSIVRGGSGQGLDLFDYLLSRCRKIGMKVSVPIYPRAEGVRPECFKGDKNISAEECFSRFRCAIKNDPKSMGYLKFVDPDIAELHWKQIEYFLQRKNPYTGTKYADEPVIAMYQLQDEMNFTAFPITLLQPEDDLFIYRLKAKWQEYLKDKYGTTEALKKSWGTLYDGESIDNMKALYLPGSYYKIKQTPATRIYDIQDFLYNLVKGYYAKLLPRIRKCASSPDKGCAVVPIAVDSIIFNRLGALNAAAPYGDYSCGTGVHTQSILNKDGWLSKIKAGPKLDDKSTLPTLLKLKGKPFVSFAGVNIVNDPYRAEAPLLRYLWGAWQNWSGVFTFWWGKANRGEKINGIYLWGKNGLIPATPEQPGEGLDVMNDEVVMAGQKVMSGVYRDGLITAAPSPGSFYFGRNALYGLPVLDYYFKLYPEMSGCAWRNSGEIILDPSGDYDFRMIGSTSPLKSPLQWPNGMTWDWNAGTLKLDSPYVKIFAGFPGKERSLMFSDGIQIDNITEGFVVFIMASKDKRPLARSEKLEFTIMSSSGNSGFSEDYSKLTYNRYRMPMPESVVTDAGKAPVKIKRVGCDIHLPFAGELTQYDFQLNILKKIKVGNRIRLSPEAPVFVSELTPVKASK